MSRHHRATALRTRAAEVRSQAAGVDRLLGDREGDRLRLVAAVLELKAMILGWPR